MTRASNISFRNNSHNFLSVLTERDEKTQHKSGSSKKYPQHRHSFLHVDKANELYNIVMSDTWQDEFKR